MQSKSNMKNKLTAFFLAATLIAIGSLTGGANAALIATNVNDVSTTIGADTFQVFEESSDLFFGNRFGGANQNTANRVALSSGNQYFQPSTVVLSLGTTFGSSLAYFFAASPHSGAEEGINFSTYDIDQNGVAETLFMLDFGADISDPSGDLILSYAIETSGSAIDLSSARSLLLATVPEPSFSALLGLGSIALILRRIRNAT
ncbi:MAG: PEP-CTERM sorting domain-containing protein [Verrucomicrobiota bacterium]